MCPRRPTECLLTEQELVCTIKPVAFSTDEQGRERTVSFFVASNRGAAGSRCVALATPGVLHDRSADARHGGTRNSCLRHRARAPLQACRDRHARHCSVGLQDRCSPSGRNCRVPTATAQRLDLEAGFVDRTARHRRAIARRQRRHTRGGQCDTAGPDHRPQLPRRRMPGARTPRIATGAAGAGHRRRTQAHRNDRTRTTHRESASRRRSTRRNLIARVVTNKSTEEPASRTSSHPHVVQFSMPMTLP